MISIQESQAASVKIIRAHNTIALDRLVSILESAPVKGHRQAAERLSQVSGRSRSALREVRRLLA